MKSVRIENPFRTTKLDNVGYSIFNSETLPESEQT